MTITEDEGLPERWESARATWNETLRTLRDRFENLNRDFPNLYAIQRSWPTEDAKPLRDYLKFGKPFASIEFPKFVPESFQLNSQLPVHARGIPLSGVYIYRAGTRHEVIFLYGELKGWQVYHQLVCELTHLISRTLRGYRWPFGQKPMEIDMSTWPREVIEACVSGQLHDRVIRSYRDRSGDESGSFQTNGFPLVSMSAKAITPLILAVDKTIYPGPSTNQWPTSIVMIQDIVGLDSRLIWQPSLHWCDNANDEGRSYFSDHRGSGPSLGDPHPSGNHREHNPIDAFIKECQKYVDLQKIQSLKESTPNWDLLSEDEVMERTSQILAIQSDRFRIRNSLQSLADDVAEIVDAAGKNSEPVYAIVLAAEQDASRFFERWRVVNPLLRSIHRKSSAGIRAGEAYLAANKISVNTPELLTRLRIQMDVAGSLGRVMTAIREASQETMRSFHEELREKQAEAYRNLWEPMFAEIREALKSAKDAERHQLESRMLPTPDSIEDWKHLARIVEMPLEEVRDGNFTLAEVFEAAIAWADRKRIEATIIASHASKTTMVFAHSSNPDDQLPTKIRKLSDSRVKAKAAYEFAMDRIENAGDMTINELHAALIESDAAEMIPAKAATLGKYLRDAGIKRYKKSDMEAGGSVVNQSDL